MFGITTTRRLREELEAERAETNRQRERADKAAARAKTEIEARRSITRQNAELDGAITRLTGRNKALGERLAEVQVANGFNPVEARRTAERIATLRKAAAAGREEATIARAEARRERRRREELQKKYDEAVGLPAGGILASGPWQPANQLPKQGKQVSP